MANRHVEDEAFRRLLEELTPANLMDEEMQGLLQSLAVPAREEIAQRTGTVVHYYGEEVAVCAAAEEEAALAAAPHGHDLNHLNGLNVGCGGRRVHPSLTGVDAHRGGWTVGNNKYSSSADILGWADELPFRESTVDYIVALHVLEHLADPVHALRHWLSVVKPGGGVGVVVPDWRYTWDARKDHDPWSHRWNPTPSLVYSLFDSHLRDVCRLEQLDTYFWKLSFDFVLRKHGRFAAFDASLRSSRIPTGASLWERSPSLFLHSDI